MRISKISQQWTLAITLATLVSACGNSNKNQTTDQTTADAETAMHEENVTTANGEQPSEKDNIVAAYLQLKDALVATDATKAAGAAATLKQALGNASDAFLLSMQQEAAAISEATDVEAQRDLFNGLSTNLYEFLKESPDESEHLYRQYCPMADDGNGAYWISNSEEIMNPYFGDKMLHCGSVDENL
ncbi:DUF3347 domain-containing protein [bacterium]|nr:DUF3347 domain-containing protein [bacterium]